MQFFTNQDDNNFQLGNFLKTLDVPLLIPGEIAVRIDIIYPSRCSDNCDNWHPGSYPVPTWNPKPMEKQKGFDHWKYGLYPVVPPKNEGVSHGFPW